MGKMTFDISYEISISIETVNQFKNDEQQPEFIRGTEEKVKLSLQDFGEILDFNNELVDNAIYKVNCKINVAPELIKLFEKRDKWEFARMMEADLRLSLYDLGEILDFKNGIEYEPDGKDSYKNLVWFNS